MILIPSRFFIRDLKNNSDINIKEKTIIQPKMIAMITGFLFKSLAIILENIVTINPTNAEIICMKFISANLTGLFTIPSGANKNPRTFGLKK